MEAIPIDAMWNYLHFRKVTATFLDQSRKRLVKFILNKMRVTNYAIAFLKRGRVVFIDDLSVEGNVRNYLQLISVRLKKAKIVFKHPNVVQNHYQQRMDLFDHSDRLKSSKHIATFRIRGIDRETSVVDDLT